MSAMPAFSQDAQTTAEKEAAYTRTITARAEKIVANLHITDAGKSARLTTIIADQYRNLNNIHTLRDEQVKALKSSGADKDAIAQKGKDLEENTNKQLAQLHERYISQLSTELTAAQVDEVKNGMTYGVLPITYRGYLDMIPTLKEEQKQQIMTWLVEAREHAMDAESSEKKHWWFGKYKGRINNYLSAAGYDLKKEGDAWEKRRQKAKAN
jgi:hypothetical protein